MCVIQYGKMQLFMNTNPTFIIFFHYYLLIYWISSNL